MRRAGRRWAAIVVAALVGFGAGSAAATVLVPMSDADLVGTSDVIALGTVGEMHSVLLGGRRVVTRITVAVEQALKGEPGSGTIVVTEAGGRVGGRQVAVFGAPEFATGERVLVFLRVRRDGTLSTNALALGKYRIEPARAGGAIARRTVPSVDERPLDALLARIGALAAGQDGVATDGRAGAAVSPGDLEAVTDSFMLAAGAENLPARWFEADCGLPIAYARANADDGFAPEVSQSALADALGAWSGDAGASLALTVGPDTAPTPSLASGTFDGRSIVQFNDPFGEVEDLVNCSGVLARGGFAGSAAAAFDLRRTVNGTTFGKIFEGDVTVNQGTGQCLGSPAALAEVLTHELGHGIGFGHSSEQDHEPDFALADATMYFRAHDDGRGASLRQDDVAALQLVYPASLEAATPLAALACEMDLGLLNNTCFNRRLPLAPFNVFERAGAAARRAAAATLVKKQKKSLKKVRRLLARTDRLVRSSITGACGNGMEATVAALRDRVAALLATL